MCVLFRRVLVGALLTFRGLKALAQLGRIREAAETLQFLLLLQHVEHNRGQQQGTLSRFVSDDPALSLSLIHADVIAHRAIESVGDATESGECTTTADTRELASNCVYLSNPARAKVKKIHSPFATSSALKGGKWLIGPCVHEACLHSASVVGATEPTL
jgi:hypothetical protein